MSHLHLYLYRWGTYTQLIEKTGFWGIFMLASWPNAFFDLCGICCGYEQFLLLYEHLLDYKTCMYVYV